MILWVNQKISINFFQEKRKEKTKTITTTASYIVLGAKTLMNINEHTNAGTHSHFHAHIRMQTRTYTLARTHARTHAWYKIELKRYIIVACMTCYEHKIIKRSAKLLFFFRLPLCTAILEFRTREKLSLFSLAKT